MTHPDLVQALWPREQGIDTLGRHVAQGPTKQLDRNLKRRLEEASGGATTTGP
jgi:hypothetical protein